MLPESSTAFAPFSAVTVWVISSPAVELLWLSSTSGTEAIVTSLRSCRSGGRRTTPKPKVVDCFSTYKILPELGGEGRKEKKKKPFSPYPSVC